MPSPFPGMDPYLENPASWPDFHHSLISGIRAALNKVLRPKYVARVEERVYISEDDDPGRQFIIPDVRVVHSGHEYREASSTAIVEIDEPITATTLIDSEIHDKFLTIMDVATREVVTAIEVLSPTNKCQGSTGRHQYLKKRAEIVNSPCHLVEIDLLRSGASTFPRSILPAHHYAVHVSRAEDRPKGKLWTIQLQKRLPVIGIPLKAGDPDAPLELQAVLKEAYDDGSYDLDIDYHQPAAPPLPVELQAWGTGLIDTFLKKA